MDLETYLPIWKQLTKEDQQALENAAVFRSVPKVRSCTTALRTASAFW